MKLVEFLVVVPYRVVWLGASLVADPFQVVLLEAFRVADPFRVVWLGPSQVVKLEAFLLTVDIQAELAYPEVAYRAGHFDPCQFGLPVACQIDLPGGAFQVGIPEAYQVDQPEEACQVAEAFQAELPTLGTPGSPADSLPGSPEEGTYCTCPAAA